MVLMAAIGLLILAVWMSVALLFLGVGLLAACFIGMLLKRLF
ncbi:hypothetical protein [Burkholderia cenocepacia]|jgi:hypothetical protein|nr:hypothetical protein [Burkholderia cenocepacia]